MALCERCQNFDIQAFSRDGFRHRGYPIASFIRAAKAGCGFCSLLLEQFLVADRGSKLKYLSIELRKQSGEWADVKWLSGEGFTLFQRWLTTVVSPVWVHFNVTRAALLPSRGTEALNIVGLKAFVSPFCSVNHEIRGYTHTVELHLGADAGEPRLTLHGSGEWLICIPPRHTRRNVPRHHRPPCGRAIHLEQVPHRGRPSLASRLQGEPPRVRPNPLPHRIVRRRRRPPPHPLRRNHTRLHRPGPIPTTRLRPPRDGRHARQVHRAQPPVG